jgi:hypothetical protein
MKVPPWNMSYKKCSRSILIFSVVLISTVILISGVDLIRAQYSKVYCQGKRDEIMSRAMKWLQQWETAASDSHGLLRSDGKQLTSEMGITLVYCGGLSDHDKLTITQMKDLIDASIDKNIDYGPPCTPLCKPGPPIT